MGLGMGEAAIRAERSPCVQYAAKAAGAGGSDVAYSP